ncbi:MAG TPA: hypothetical protein VE243_08745, partial [Candidatus Acidoferrum sp.]|nr:hypothetical protein [Candidatus Acidoferrum sp.]
MDPEAASVITPHLLVGEELLWCGRPHDRTALLRARIGAILLVGTAALLMRSLPFDPSVAEGADTISIELAVLLFVLIAEASVFHAHLTNTFYGVTSQRVMIVSGLREREMTAVFLDLLNSRRLRVQRVHNTVELIPAVDG